MPERSVQIRVYGIVQGVNYRHSTNKEAEQLGVYGIVQNEPDGSVYIEATGTFEQIEKLIEWCRKGPPRSKVERVDVKNGVSKGFSRFEIKKVLSSGF